MEIQVDLLIIVSAVLREDWADVVGKENLDNYKVICNVDKKLVNYSVDCLADDIYAVEINVTIERITIFYV